MKGEYSLQFGGVLFLLGTVWGAAGFAAEDIVSAIRIEARAKDMPDLPTILTASAASHAKRPTDWSFPTSCATTDRTTWPPSSAGTTRCSVRRLPAGNRRRSRSAFSRRRASSILHSN
jgi:hypothetical protein